MPEMANYNPDANGALDGYASSKRIETGAADVKRMGDVACARTCRVLIELLAIDHCQQGQKAQSGLGCHRLISDGNVGEKQSVKMTELDADDGENALRSCFRNQGTTLTHCRSL